ncbi:MAG: TonB-dependent receptor, partial [Solirubrobacteraceae bacterium]
AYTLASDSVAHAWQYQGYALVRAGLLDDHLQVMSGLSQVWTKNTTASELGGPGSTLQGAKTTYLEGVVLKPATWMSLYGSASSNASISSVAGTPAVWQPGTEREVGLKTENSGDRLGFTADYFWVRQTNLASQNPLYNLNPAAYPQEVLTDEANHGAEFEVVGGVTRNLSVVLDYTAMRLRDEFGRRLRNIPDETANALLDYRIGAGAFRRLSLIFGVQHNGDVAGETVTGFTSLGIPEKPGFYLPGWTVENLGLSYPWRKFRLELNLDNALDARFPWQPAGRNSISPYPGRAVRLRTAYHF